MVNIGKTKSVKQSLSSTEYIMRDTESLLVWSNISSDKEEILNKVNEYSQIEKNGNKELGIRGRYDAQCMSKLIISLPNTNSVDKNKEKIDEFLRSSGIEKYPFVVSIHKGENGDRGIKNSHAHINFFQRTYSPGKNNNKNREFSKKDFIEKATLQYQKAFGFQSNNEEEKRQRIGRMDWKEYRSKITKINNNMATTKTELDQAKRESPITSERLQYNMNASRINRATAEIDKALKEQSAASRQGREVKPIDYQAILEKHGVKVETRNGRTVLKSGSMDFSQGKDLMDSISKINEKNYEFSKAIKKHETLMQQQPKKVSLRDNFSKEGKEKISYNNNLKAEQSKAIQPNYEKSLGRDLANAHMNSKPLPIYEKDQDFTQAKTQEKGKDNGIDKLFEAARENQAKLQNRTKDNEKEQSMGLSR